VIHEKGGGGQTGESWRPSWTKENRKSLKDNTFVVKRHRRRNGRVAKRPRTVPGEDVKKKVRTEKRYQSKTKGGEKAEEPHTRPADLGKTKRAKSSNPGETGHNRSTSGRVEELKTRGKKKGCGGSRKEKKIEPPS